MNEYAKYMIAKFPKPLTICLDERNVWTISLQHGRAVHGIGNSLEAALEAFEAKMNK